MQRTSGSANQHRPAWLSLQTLLHFSPTTENPFVRYFVLYSLAAGRE